MKRRSRAKKAAKKAKQARKPKVRSARRKAPRRAAMHSLKKNRFSGKPKSSSKKRVSRSSKPAKRRASSPSSDKKTPQSLMFEPLEQVTVACSNCGRQFNIVKLHGLSMEGMICQRCSIGEVEFPE